jgi:hypothetical protein
MPLEGQANRLGGTDKKRCLSSKPDQPAFLEFEMKKEDGEGNNPSTSTQNRLVLVEPVVHRRRRKKKQPEETIAPRRSLLENL